VPVPTQFLIEGIDRVGKDTLVDGLLDRLGYHLVIHYERPPVLEFYRTNNERYPERRFQEDSFRTLFRILQHDPIKMIANRSHLGEVVYAPYRNYSGEYVFDLEQELRVEACTHVRLILLTEDFSRSLHFVDDAKSLGTVGSRQSEQEAFLRAFHRSLFRDKRMVCVTDHTGGFRARELIVNEILA